jgi:hypothetical protein
VIEAERQGRVACAWHTLRDRAHYPDIVQRPVPGHVNSPCCLTQPLVVPHLRTVPGQPVTARWQRQPESAVLAGREGELSACCVPGDYRSWQRYWCSGRLTSCPDEKAAHGLVLTGLTSAGRQARYADRRYREDVANPSHVSLDAWSPSLVACESCPDQTSLRDHVVRSSPRSGILRAAPGPREPQGSAVGRA